MNNFHPFKRRGGRLAFAFSCLLHIAVGTIIFFVARKRFVDQLSMGPGAANSNIMQIELQSVAASSAQPASPLPTPKPVEVPLEEIQKMPEPQPEPVVSRPAEANESRASAEAQTAQVAQKASAAGAQVEAAETLSGQSRAGEVDWRKLGVAKLSAMIEREKYYPPAAERAGYTGEFKVLIRLDPDGTIASCEITERHGHPLLGRGVEAMLSKIQGRNIGMRLPERFEFTQPIVFLPPP